MAPSGLGLTKFSIGEFTYNPKTSALTPTRSNNERMARLRASAASQRPVMPSPKRASPKRKSPPQRKSPSRPKATVHYVRTASQNLERMARLSNNRYKLLKELEAGIRKWKK